MKQMKTNVEHNGHDALSKGCMGVADTEPEVSESIDPVSAQSVESFTRETFNALGGNGVYRFRDFRLCIGHTHAAFGEGVMSIVLNVCLHLFHSLSLPKSIAEPPFH